jgi:quinol monooxygenase YgiN
VSDPPLLRSPVGSEQEVAVSAPFIVKSVSRIHPGKADAYRPVVAEFCKLAEEREPRLLGFHIYVDEDRSSETVIQIHPDADSMQHHLDVMGPQVRETFAFTDFERLEIYGEPNDALEEWIPRVSQGIAFTFHPVHWGGFTRLQAG